ncbi:alkaline phosphatase synthesis sensor protein PhoR [Lachnospiraceae bacterium]|nr:alkaline phosphatase synthesis sensor protein PhoR [Lachnospiraceae bacterium]
MVKLEQNIDGFEVKDTKIRQTILDAVDMVYEKLENKKIRLIMEPFEDIQLYHNRKWTAEVFVNLLENAVKYTREGGSVSIGVKTYEIYTEIRIADNGRGIRQEELTDIFKRFYRSREAEDIEGSGIGLYLSGLILEKEKGYMTVVSEYGEGSCFSVFLQNCKN